MRLAYIYQICRQRHNDVYLELLFDTHLSGCDLAKMLFLNHARIRLPSIHIFRDKLCREMVSQDSHMTICRRVFVTWLISKDLIQKKYLL